MEEQKYCEVPGPAALKCWLCGSMNLIQIVKVVVGLPRVKASEGMENRRHKCPEPSRVEFTKV